MQARSATIIELPQPEFRSRDLGLLSNYQLIDFGAGRRLELIDGFVFDRPCPAADGTVKSIPQRWRDADARFDDSRGWNFKRTLPDSLHIDASGHFQLQVDPKPFGHLGFFPEQADNWQWLHSLVTQFGDASGDAMNLFGYTGGSTLCLASAGMRVAHVDASKPSVSCAGENARRSGLGDAVIRYIVDDARKFVSRELRRDRRYDIIVLDPPAYGHGKSGAAWKLERDLWPMLEQCIELLNERSAMLFTGHSEMVSAGEVARWLRSIGKPGLQVSHQRATIADSFNKPLDAGYVVRATWNLERST